MKLLKILAILVFLMFAGAVAGPAHLSAAESADTEFAEDGEDAEFLEDEEFLDEDLERDGGGTVSVPDPLRPVNYAIHLFNDKLYLWVLKPVASGYKAVVPIEIRVCTSNFFDNLYAPVRFANCLLQGKFKNAASEFGKFFVNTTAGGLGLGDVAQRYPELNPPEEDFGQTLGYWGVGNGFYLVLPVLGPSTLRDGIGRLGDRAADPLTYLNPRDLAYGVSAGKTINDFSFRLDDLDAIRRAAIDPYEAFRDGYIQYRRAKVRQ